MVRFGQDKGESREIYECIGENPRGIFEKVPFTVNIR